MNKEQFWTIIDSAREEAKRRQDMEKPLLEALLQLEPAEIVHRQQILNDYRIVYDNRILRAAAAVMQGGCSDDGFVYFVCWLTAQGKDVFLKALADPDSPADVEAVKSFRHRNRSDYPYSMEFEAMMYVAVCVYEQKMRNDAGFYEKFFENPLSIEEQENIEAEIIYYGGVLFL